MTEVLRNLQEEDPHAEESDDEEESLEYCWEDGVPTDQEDSPASNITGLTNHLTILFSAGEPNARIGNESRFSEPTKLLKPST